MVRGRGATWGVRLGALALSGLALGGCAPTRENQSACEITAGVFGGLVGGGTLGAVVGETTGNGGAGAGAAAGGVAAGALVGYLLGTYFCEPPTEAPPPAAPRPMSSVESPAGPQLGSNSGAGGPVTPSVRGSCPSRCA